MFQGQVLLYGWSWQLPRPPQDRHQRSDCFGAISGHAAQWDSHPVSFPDMRAQHQALRAAAWRLHACGPVFRGQLSIATALPGVMLVHQAPSGRAGRGAVQAPGQDAGGADVRGPAPGATHLWCALSMPHAYVQCTCMCSALWATSMRDKVTAAVDHVAEASCCGQHTSASCRCWTGAATSGHLVSTPSCTGAHKPVWLCCNSQAALYDLTGVGACRWYGPKLSSASVQQQGRQAFLARRNAEAWEFGSGSDYKH